MFKEISCGEENKKRIQAGVDQLVDAIKVTLGPKGRNVSITRKAEPLLVTNDGAAIAKAVDLEDSVANMGAQLICEAVSKTNAQVGDGTTTSAVLTQSMIHEGIKNIAAGANPMELKKGILTAAQVSAAAISKLARPANSRTILAQVASVSSNDMEIGGMIADAMERVGQDGIITVDEAAGHETVLDITLGMQFDRGFMSPYMATDREKLVAELKHPYILITDEKISDIQVLLPVLEEAKKWGRSILIIAEEITGDALGTLVLNKMNGILDIVAVRPPAYGDGRRHQMQDIAVFTGAVFVSQSTGYSLGSISVDVLGSAGQVIIKKDHTLIVDGAGDKQALQTYTDGLRMMIEKTDYEFNCERMKERLAKLTGGIAVIRAGAATEPEMKEKKLRIEDAVHAVKSAAAEGVVPGGGVAFLNTLPAVNAYVDSLAGDMKTGAKIVQKSLRAPVRQIACNAGEEGNMVVQKLLSEKAGVGFDVLTGQYVNMFEAGIVDPAKTARSALLNAASAAATLLTTDACVAEAAEGFGYSR